MKIDINSIGYRWKGIYSPYLTYIDGDVVYQNGSVFVYRGGTLQNFALGQQDALLAGYLLNGGVSVGGRFGQVLHSNGASGVEFRFESQRGGTIATALLDTYNGGGAQANDHYMMTLMNEGMIRSWGRNYTGSLGIGRPDDIGNSQPKRVAFPSDAPRIVSMHATWNATFFIGADGSLWTVGSNDEYANGTNAVRTVPVKLNGYGDLGANTVVTKVFSGFDYYGYRRQGCIDSNGYVYMWGTNQQGSCGWGNTTESPTPKIVPWSVTNPCKDVWIAAGTHAATMFVKLDGTAYMAGESGSTGLGVADRYIPTRFAPWDTSDPVKKYAGAESDAHWAGGAQYYRAYGVLLENGDLYMWGHDSGQVGGGWGTGFTGDIFPGEPNFPLLCLTNVQDFFTKGGGYHASVALMKDGTVKATGHGPCGTVSDSTTWQTIGGSYLTGVTKIRGIGGTYANNVTALRSDGRCVSWGNLNGTGIQGWGTDAENTGALWEYVLLDKPVVDFQYTGTGYGGNSDIACFYLCTDGSVYHTGQGSYGQGGSRENNNRYTPSQIIF